MNARSETDAGFTIVETMIFLAISGLMFVVAVSAMSGKQQTTEFQTGIGTLRSDLNQDLSNVSNGSYTLNTNVTCSAQGSNEPSYSTTASTPDGTCVLIGEIIAFSNNTGQQKYTIYPVIGHNYDPTNTSEVATTLSEATPYISSSQDQVVTMPFGLQVDGSATSPTSIVANHEFLSSSTYGSIGVFSFTSFEGEGSTTAVASSSLNSGSSHVEVFAVPGSQLSESSSSLAADVLTLDNCEAGLNSTVCDGANNDLTDVNPPGGVIFCVNSGSTSQSALFTVGGTNSPTAATYQIYSNQGCTN